MDTYTWTQETEHWSCGDGCCDGTNTTVFVNGAEIGSYADLGMVHLDAIDRLIGVLNQGENNLTLSFTAKADTDGDLQDVVYLNDAFLTNSVWNAHLYTDILEGLKLPFRSHTFEVDWDVWQAEKRLVLILEEADEDDVS